MAGWFVLREGIEEGPHPAGRLRAMAAAGTIRPDDKVRREDMKAPVTAESVKGLFPDPNHLWGAGGTGDGPAGGSGPTAAESSLPWYYARRGVRHGPVPFAELKSLTGAGGLAAEDLVWRTDMPEWVRAGEVEGLSAGSPAARTHPGDRLPPAPPLGSRHESTPLPDPSITEAPHAPPSGEEVFAGIQGGEPVDPGPPAGSPPNRTPLDRLRALPVGEQRFVAAAVGAVVGVALWPFFGGFLGMLVAGVFAGWLAEIAGDRMGPDTRLARSPARFLAVVAGTLAVVGAMGLFDIGVWRMSPFRSDGPKLAAFRKVVKKYEAKPGDLASGPEREKFNRELEALQQQFFDVPFDPKKDRKQAEEVVKLYMDRIEHRYSGAQPDELNGHIRGIMNALRE